MSSTLTPYPQIIAHFSTHDPVIASILKDLDISSYFTEPDNTDYFYALTQNIISQQLSTSAASTIFARLENALEGSITPQSIARISAESLRKLGLSWSKVSYVKDLASKVLAKELDLTDLGNLSNDAVIANLIKVKGIGRWTAEMFLLFTLHRENIFSSGDLGLKSALNKLYGGKLALADIAQIVASWDPYQSYASLALWHHLDNPTTP